MNAELRHLDALARVEDPDPALLPMQLDALRRLEVARKTGTQEDIDNALDVAQELRALGLVF